MIRNIKAAKTSGLTLYKEAIRSIHTLCSQKSTPTWPFDVKPPTYESFLKLSV